MTDYYKVLENLEKLEETMTRINLYNKTRGGGVLWPLCFWPLYVLFLYELVIVRDKITYVSEMLGITIFFAIGCFLTYGVYRQIKLNRRLYTQVGDDYKNMVEKKLVDIFTKDTQLATKDVMQNLLTSAREFRKKYWEE